MKKFLLLAIVLSSVSCIAQYYNNDVSIKYFYHWESVNPLHNNMEIIIHKESGKARVTEIKFDHDGKFGQAIVYSTVYVCKNKKGKMVVETVNPSTLQIHNSEYILTKDKKLLRVTNNDTIVFKRRY